MPDQLTLALAAAVSLQGLCLTVDELHYHKRRRLRRFESLGHPLDTALFLLPVAVAAWASPAWLPLYVALAVLSCLAITKDEWIHAGSCPGGELWLHAVLFMLHPVVLIALGAAWQRGVAGALRGALPPLVLGFGLYQLGYWNFYAPRRGPHDGRRATTRQ